MRLLPVEDNPQLAQLIQEGLSSQGFVIDRCNSLQEAHATRAGSRLGVRDRGPRFKPETVEHLFRRFWRGPSPERAGAGLGLAIARTLLSRHGAYITANNASDGAVFTVQWS